MNHRHVKRVIRAALLSTGALCFLTARAADKPTAYSSHASDREGTVRSAESALSDRFTIAPVRENDQFLPAQVIKRTVHPYIREVGRVTIAAVADVNGRFRDPVVIESTNSRLNNMMRSSVKNWVCMPARLNGKPVPSVTQSTIEVRWRQPIRFY